MKKTGLEIVNEKAAKIVAFFDIPKPQKKRMFLTGIALGFLVLSWCVPEVDAAPAMPSKITCGGVGGYAFVTTDLKVYGNGGYLFSEETGFIGCSSLSAGICAWKADGTAKCTNGETFTDVAWISNSWLDNYSSLSDPTYYGGVVKKNDGTFVKTSGAQYDLSIFPSSVTFISPGYDFYSQSRDDGTVRRIYTFGTYTPWTVSSFQAGSQNGGGVAQEAFLNLDGSATYWGGSYPAGSIKYLAGMHRGFSCFLGEDETAKCGASSGYAGVIANTPTFPVRDLVVWSVGPSNGEADVRVGAVRISDNKFYVWDATNSAAVLGGAPTPEGGSSAVIIYPDGTECYNFTVPKLSSVAWMTPEFMFSTGTVTTQVFTGGSNYGCTGWGQKCGDKIRTLNDDGSGNMDFLTLYNYDSSSVIRTPSWRNPATATGPRSTLIADDFEPQILGIGSIRENVKFAADVWQFASVQNPGINVPWAYWISEGKGVNQVFATGGTATLVNANMTTSLTLFLQEFSVPPIGFRMGKSTEQESKTQCRIGNNACTWELRGTEYQCVSKIYNSYAGVCSVDSNGRCAPTITASGTVSEALPLEGSNVTTDQYGNVISVTPGNSNVQGTTVNIDGVFDCADYDGFLDIFPCSLQVAKNVWQLVSDSVNQTDSAARSVTDTMSSVSSGSTGSINLSPVSMSGANLAEKMFIGAWNNTWEMNEFNKWGYFALIGSLFLMVLAVVFVIALINRK